MSKKSNNKKKEIKIGKSLLNKYQSFILRKKSQSGFYSQLDKKRLKAIISLIKSTYNFLSFIQKEIFQSDFDPQTIIDILEAIFILMNIK